MLATRLDIFNTQTYHELQIASLNCPFMPSKVLVVNSTGKKVGDSLLASVRMIGKPSAWSDAKVVQHEEWCKVAQLARAH